MAASRTAQYVALYRAFETYERRRAPLFRDLYAQRFLDRPLALVVSAARAPVLRGLLERYADRRSPGSRTSAIARTAYIDDAVRAAAAGGIDQVVILGAGFDCRAHRMPELRGISVFEVDRADTQAAKRARVPDGASVRYVAVDFLRDEVGERLEAAGWRPGQRSLFIWEGVTNYLNEDAVAKVLRWFATTAVGSTLVFTYVHRGLLDGTVPFVGGELMLENVKRLGEPWTFGLRPAPRGAAPALSGETAPGGVAPGLPAEVTVSDFVARAGLRLRDDLGADEYRRRYLGNAPMAGYAFYRIALADVPGIDRGA